MADLPEFDAKAFREGHLSPVIFGSALKDFGVAELLDCLARFAPDALPRKAADREVEPAEKTVSGFVFKVQANMDPNHRDRVAFVRLCSGKFRRGMRLFNVREKKPMNVAAPIFFFAQQRETIDEAFPGDIIGIPNHGTLHVGDTLTEGEALRFTGVPNFAPEVLRRIVVSDGLKAKQMNKALTDLSEEGVVQIFRPRDGSWPILGAVGTLQFEVLASRLEQEYGVTARLEAAPYETARWITSAKARRAAAVLRCKPLEHRRRQCRFAGLSCAQRMGAQARGGGLARHRVRERDGAELGPRITTNTAP